MVLLVGFIGSVTYYGVCQYQRMNTSFLDKYDTDKVSEYQNVENVYPVLHPRAIFSAWYRAIIDAKENVYIVTYTWKMWEVKEGSGVYPAHIVTLGHAFRELDNKLEGSGRKVKIHILGDHTYTYVKTSFINDAVIKSLQIWEKMGIKWKHIDLEIRLWKHAGFNNIHTKMVLVDMNHYIASSINFETPSSGHKESWMESGVYLHDNDSLNCTNMLEHFNYCWQDSTIMEFDITKYTDIKFHEVCYDRQDNRLSVKEFVDIDLVHVNDVECLTLYTNPGPSVPTTTYRKSMIMDELCKKLLSAKKSIKIISPNYNETSIVNIVSKFNNSQVISNVGRISQFSRLIGYSPNNMSYMPHWKNFSNTNIRCHIKLFIVDDEWCMTGSFNADTFSALHSSENMVAINDPVATKVFVDFFDKQWQTNTK